MVKENFLRAIIQMLLLGDSAIITQYNKETNNMELYVPHHDSVVWLTNKNNTITDIFLRHEITLYQAKQEFTEQEFSKIIKLYSITDDDLKNNLNQNVYLIQRIKVATEKMKPHYSCWIADIGEDETEIIKKSYFQDLPVHIMRHKPNINNGRGQSFVLPIYRTLNELHNLKLSFSIATTRGLEQNILIHEELFKQIDIRKPGQILSAGEDLMREQNLVRPLTTEIDANIIQLADSRIEKLVAEVNKVLVQDDFTQSLAGAGMNSAKPGKPESFDAYFKQDLAQWAQVVKSANITPE
jgi:hypothetical protein